MFNGMHHVCVLVSDSNFLFSLFYSFFFVFCFFKGCIELKIPCTDAWKICLVQNISPKFSFNHVIKLANTILLIYHFINLFARATFTFEIFYIFFDGYLLIFLRIMIHIYLITHLTPHPNEVMGARWVHPSFPIFLIRYLLSSHLCNPCYMVVVKLNNLCEVFGLSF